MEKAYTRTNWVDETPPYLDAENLNNIERGIDTLDDRVVELSEKQDTFLTEEEVSSTYATKEELKGISETVTEVATEVSKGKADVILANAQGESIHATDTTECKAVEFALVGKATQKQYSGKNLLPLNMLATQNGITGTIANEKLVLNGTSSVSNGNVQNLGTIELTEGQKCIMTFPTIPSNANVRLQLYYLSDYTKLNVQCPNNGSLEVTAPLTGTYRVYVITTSTVTLSNLVCEPMVRLASVTDSTYEPFVGGIPSPNPEYKQDIEVSGADGSVEVKSLGKNFIKNKLSSFNTQGIKFVAKEDGSVVATGTQTAHAYYHFGYDKTNSLLPYVDVTKKYILSGNTTTNSDEWGYCLFLQINLENGTTRYVFNNNPVDVEVDFNSYNSISPITSIIPYIRIGVDAPKPVNVTFYPMLSLEGGEYEPYKESTATISTANGLASINGVCDEIVKYADGTGKKIQRIGKAVFDGSDDEGWGMSGSVVGRMYGNVWKTNGTRNFISNMCYQVATYPDKVMGEAFIGADGNINIMTSFDNVSDWKSYLASNPMTVYYELAEHIITDLSAEEVAELEVKTFYPTTNILNDAGCGMEVTYKADTKNYIDKIIGDRLSALEMALINSI